MQAQVGVQAAAVGGVDEQVLPARLDPRDDGARERPAVDPGADERPQAARGAFQRVSLGHPATVAAASGPRDTSGVPGYPTPEEAARSTAPDSWPAGIPTVQEWAFVVGSSIAPDGHRALVILGEDRDVGR